MKENIHNCTWLKCYKERSILLRTASLQMQFNYRIETSMEFQATKCDIYAN